MLGRRANLVDTTIAMPIRISMITWNSLFRPPSPDFVEELVYVLAEGGMPDLVVVAMQEAPVDPRKRLDVALMQHEDMQEWYSPDLDFAWLGGRTKQMTMTAMSVLRKNGSHRANQTAVRMGRVGANGKRVKGTAGNVWGWSTKGGIYAIVDHVSGQDGTSKRIGLIGAHLGAKDEQTRERQIAGLLRELVSDDGRARKWFAKPLSKDEINKRLRRDFDAVFFMGDLNYRLAFDQELVLDSELQG